MNKNVRLAFALLVPFLALPAAAQTLTAPPSGDNQRATVTQSVGPVKVTIDYSSPRVHLRGEDRRGKIWGKLVPYGMADLGFNDCKSCPWRAGANENTVFTVSHDVTVQGKSLPAGSYGLHMIPGTDEWTVIFSKNSGSWGSFFYDPKEDALRVTTKAVKTDFHEWLTYEFIEREPAKATVALEWEELRVPIAISVENAPALWVAKMGEELRSSPGFSARNWQQAADYCLANKINLPVALTWAERSVNPAVGGEESFSTLMTLSRVQAANGKAADADKTFERAIAHPTATPTGVHGYARQMQGAGQKDEAVRIFQANAKRFPNQWPVNVGMARASSALGDSKKALEFAKKALAQAPDDGNRKNLEGMIKKLEDGQQIN